MSNTNFPVQVDDTVYSADGEMGLYVSTAKGGGYIVQPLIQGVEVPAAARARLAQLERIDAEAALKKATQELQAAEAVIARLNGSAS